LPKNGGNLSSGNVCTGFFGSWNAVATDSDEQAYVTGQQGIGSPPTSLSGDWYRYRATGALNSATPGLIANDANFGVAVNNQTRQEFTIGTFQATGTTGGPGYLTLNGATIPVNIIAPDSTIANGGEDISFIGVQWNDVFVTPTVITLGPVAINTTPAPFAIVSTLNSQQNAVACTVPVPNPNNGVFTIQALPSTGTYSITLNTGTIGAFSGSATFTCGGDNGASTVFFTGTVSGNLVATPSNTLTATSVIASGILQPYNTLPGNATITVDVTTAAGSVAYSTGQNSNSRSANWPNCGLISLSGGGTATNNLAGPSQFFITINSNCANQLAVGEYHEDITVTAAVSGTASAATPLHFSLTITSGGAITQNLSNFVFGTSTTPQAQAFTVQAPTTAALTYLATFGPFGTTNPLPAANASIVSGRTGTIPANGSGVVTIQVSPAGLAAGVYGFCYTISSVVLTPNVGPVNACALVYVGTGIGFIAPANGILNIRVPAGYPAASLTQPPTINVTGLSNYSTSPYSISLPSGSSISFTPALPAASAFVLTGGSPCTTYAQFGPSNTNGGTSCFYTATVDSTLLVANTTYVGTITFKGPSGVSSNLTVNLTATQFPEVSWVSTTTGAPLPSITFTSAVNASNTISTLCSNTGAGLLNGASVFDALTVTGGVLPNVVLSINPTISWLGLYGAQGTPGSLGVTTNPAIGTVNLTANTFNFQNVCVSAANIKTPGTYVGTLSATAPGVNSTANLQVIFIVSGTGMSNVGVFRPGFGFLLDANGNTLFDGAGVGLDLVENFGGAAGDVAISGDWSGSGTTKIGVYRPSNGLFILDYNDNGTFDGQLLDRVYQFFPTPTAGDVPVVGDWTGTGTYKIGIYRPSTGQWFLDLNGNGVYDAGVDALVNYGGITTPIADVPVVGDWNGSGTSKIGIFRAGFLWILDSNGNGSFDAADAVFPFGGIAGDVPVVGDWNGTGPSKVGVFRLGFFFVLDTNGDHLFTPGEQAFPFGGIAGDVPVIGKWRKP
jgi:hypothetical protein